MALFHHKKKAKKKEAKPHDFPEFSDHTDLPEFPSKDKFTPKDSEFDLDSFSPEEDMESLDKTAFKPETDLPKNPDLGGRSSPKDIMEEPTNIMDEPMETAEKPMPQAAPESETLLSEPANPEPMPSKSFADDEKRTFFVKIDNYENAIDTVKQIKELTEDAKDTLKKIKQLKQKEDEELSDWEENLSHLKSKILEIDKSLFQDREMV